MRGRFALTSSLLVAVTIVACATAGGQFTAGEEKFDASKPPTPEAVCNIEKGSGEKWSDLHRDIFGPTGQPGSCSLRTSCHGTADSLGTKESFGFECGADKAVCRKSLIDTNLVNTDDKAAPDKSNLVLGILRTRNPDGTLKGIMPQEPKNCVFTDKTLARINAWIANGIPDD